MKYFLYNTCVFLLVYSWQGYHVVDAISSTIIATDCLQPNDNPGFCVPYKDCVVFNRYRSSLARWGCGPKDQDPENPKVCCNRRHILIRQSLFPESCGKQNAIHDRVLGGEPTPERSFPWLVKLLRRNSEYTVRFACSGALIHPRVVLSAAHCLVSRELEAFGPLYAVSMRIERESQFREYSISHKVAHRRYNVRTKYIDDIGLIFLKNEVVHSVPVCLLQKAEEPLEYIFSGWSQTQDLQSPELKTVPLLPFSWQQCYEKFRFVANITENQICAGGEKNKDTCIGDSGGPLMTVKNGTTWYVAGIVSFGLACGSEGWPGVYTHVPKYILWIKNQMDQGLAT